MENRIVELEKELSEMRSLMRFKRECLAVALDNNLYKVQEVLYDEISHLRADIGVLQSEYEGLVKEKRVISEENFKKEINENYKCRH